MLPTEQPVIFFDGICNLCTRSIQVVLQHDTKKRFRFASLQSSIADEMMSSFLGNERKPDSFVLIENGRMFTRSTAALRVARKLDGLFPLLYGFIIIPRFIRDAVYRFIAANRFRWFGKKETCWSPNSNLSARFLDQVGPSQHQPPDE